MSQLHASCCVQGAEPQEKEEEGARQTITDINKHAAAVMRGAGDPGRSAAQGLAPRPNPGMDSQVLDDLRRPDFAGFSELSIQDPKRLHDSAVPPLASEPLQQGLSDLSHLTDTDALGAVQVREWLQSPHPHLLHRKLHIIGSKDNSKCR